MGAKKLGVALKPQERPLELPDALLQRQLANEFHVRYLESIGAAPTPFNMALARREMPIENCKITTAWKSRGWNADCVFITPQTEAADGAGGRKAISYLPHGGALQELQEKLLQPLVPQPVAPQSMGAQDDPEHEKERTVVAGATRAPKGPMQFSEAQDRFLYPFKRQGPAAAARIAINAHSSSRGGTNRPGGSELELSLDQLIHAMDEDSESYLSVDAETAFQRADIAARFSSRDPVKFSHYPPKEVLQELQTPLSISTKEIVSLQMEFSQNFPFEKIRERLDDASMRVTLEELRSKRSTRLIGLVALFLYWAHLAPLAQKEIAEEQLAALYCTIQQDFNATRDRMKARRTTLLFSLPALLLLMRVVVEALFRHAFPKWWTTVEGEGVQRGFVDRELWGRRTCCMRLLPFVWGHVLPATLALIDASMERIFDPNAYLSHISPLESTTAAIRIAARESQGARSGDRRNKYFATSAMVASALPGSRMVRRQEVPGVNGSRGLTSLPSVAMSLPREARKQLYTSALQRAETNASRRSTRPTETGRRQAIDAVGACSMVHSTSLKELVQRREVVSEDSFRPFGNRLAAK